MDNHSTEFLFNGAGLKKVRFNDAPSTDTSSKSTPHEDTPLMVLSNLRSFHHSMTNHGKTSARIPFTYAKTPLDVHFFATGNPFALGIGKRGANPIYFEIPVYRGYRINVMLDENYNPLRKALNFDSSHGGKFSTAAFFKSLNSHIPASYSDTSNELRPEHRAVYERDVDEAEKVFFMGWQHNGDLGIRKPTQRNLDKTLRLLGPAALERSKRENLSSRWTDVKKWAIRVSYGSNI